MALVRGTTVSVDGKGVVLRGPSGAGKSDVALRLIDAGAMLVADDNTEVVVKGAKALAGPPETLKGLLEVRGLGILKFPVKAAVPIALVVDLVAREDVPRLPEPETAEIEGVPVRRISLHAFDASTPSKIKLALAQP